MIRSLGAFAAVGVVSLWATAAQADGWRMTERTGGVTVLHAGVSKIALQGSEVAEGDVVSTGSNGRAVLVRGSDYLIVAPSSRLHVATPSQPNDLVQIIQDFGSAIFKIKHLERPHFSVKTPYLAVVVKGTTFSVTVGEAGTAVQVIDGAVEVVSNDGGARSLIKSGMIGQISARDVYRLHVTGDTSSDIVSPNAPAGKPADASSSDEPAVGTTTQNLVASSPANVIETPIAETGAGTSLSQTTAGLIEGNTSLSSSLNGVARTTVLATTLSASSAPPVSAAIAPNTAPVPVAPASPVAVAAAPATPVAAAPIAATAPVVTVAVTPPAMSVAAAAPAVVATPVVAVAVAAPTTPVVAATPAATVAVAAATIATPTIAAFGNTTGCATACVISYTYSSSGKNITLFGNTFTVSALASNVSASALPTVNKTSIQGGLTAVTVTTHNSVQTAIAILAVKLLVK